ncbi:DUF1643 domain-containing protein [Niabella soli]|uniref:Uncharacterized protein n=1 Tax=Niabella soli DSM 19437 TaxID=929713 RepID=W0EXE0_9BACT|nr:DUF1643 domain-containing protein [Niabella soli]AHF15447.1 hypothetical protein NIASO_10365 [Niabella soli DSM 19437]
MKEITVFSPDRKYRYQLVRIFDETRPLVAFLGDHPFPRERAILQKHEAYAKENGFGGFVVGNLFALISNIREFRYQEDSIGLDNDKHLANIIANVAKMVPCWKDRTPKSKYLDLAPNGKKDSLDRESRVYDLFFRPYSYKMGKPWAPRLQTHLNSAKNTKKLFFMVHKKSMLKRALPLGFDNLVKLEKGIYNCHLDEEILRAAPRYLTSDQLNHFRETNITDVVQSIITVSSSEDFCLDLHLFVRYDIKTPVGQFNYYYCNDFVNSQTNLNTLFWSIADTTGYHLWDLLKPIMKQFAQLRNKLQPGYTLYFRNQQGETIFFIKNKNVQAKL